MVGDKTLFVQAKMSFTPLKKKHPLGSDKKKKSKWSLFSRPTFVFFFKKKLSIWT
jgi:hypothetical protein